MNDTPTPAAPPRSADEKRMTDDDLKEIRERAKRATWWHESECGVEVVYDGEDEHHEEPIYVARRGATLGGACVGVVCPYDNDGDDWNFLAHAREDVPKLLDEIDSLRLALDRARGAEKELRKACEASVHHLAVMNECVCDALRVDDVNRFGPKCGPCMVREALAARTASATEEG